ncbi:hypothetical protein [Uliginosibacterium sediminicola]|uniref:Uncharacterized protein n=1 Tax=Uliginosibacterium sediminicola TaxID=2024550 RepID=A0ABU9YVY5_9RHOO
MNQILKKACRYVRNTNGGATSGDFIDDHSPVGHQIWRDLTVAGLVRVDNAGRIFITDAGASLLEEKTIGDMDDCPSCGGMRQ